MTTMTTTPTNKFRTAMEVLQRGRDLLVEEMADQIIDQEEHFLDGGYLFNEFLEGQGTRLHFLGLLLAQLEQSAEQLEEAEAKAAQESEPPKPKPRRKPRPKKMTEQASREGERGET